MLTLQSSQGLPGLDYLILPVSGTTVLCKQPRSPPRYPFLHGWRFELALKAETSHHLQGRHCILVFAPALALGAFAGFAKFHDLTLDS